MADSADNGGQGYAGQAGITSPGSGHNARALQHRIQQDARRTTVPVKIIKIYGGGTAGTPTADVQPLIDQVDGLGEPEQHQQRRHHDPRWRSRPHESDRCARDRGRPRQIPVSGSGRAAG